MKLSILITLVLVFILVMSSCYAICPEPDISTYSKCTDGCPDPVAQTTRYADCINDCLSMWNKMQDEYYECQKTEREQAEKKRIEEEKKFTQQKEEEVKELTVSTLEGALWLTNPEGLVKHIVPPDFLIQARPGDLLRTDVGSHAELTFKDGRAIQIGPDTVVLYKDGEFYTYLYVVFRGRIRFKSDPSKSKAKVTTPGGTATDRQTDFIAEVDPDTNTTSFYLYEGILDVNTTKGEMIVLNTGQMITIDSSGNAVISDLIIEDWDGMVRSIETGEEYVPSHEMQADMDRKQETLKVIYLILIMAAVLIVLIAVLVRRRKGSK